MEELEGENWLTVVWVPGHKGNEEANGLTRKGASKALFDTEPRFSSYKVFNNAIFFGIMLVFPYFWRLVFLF